jgi:hypothetical protein
MCFIFVFKFDTAVHSKVYCMYKMEKGEKILTFTGIHCEPGIRDDFINALISWIPSNPLRLELL